MPTLPPSLIRSIKRLAARPDSPVPLEQAVERARLLSEQIPLERYNPNAIARSTLQLPAQARGFSEAVDTYTPPLTAVLIRPSEFLERTPPLQSLHDQRIVDSLTSSMKDEGMRTLPFIKVDELPAPNYRQLLPEGRHRMTAQRELYGDDPVLVNWLKGSRFDRDARFPEYLSYIEESSLSPLELMKRDIKFGFYPEEIPIKLDPLW